MRCRQMVAVSLMTAILVLAPVLSSWAQTLIVTSDGREHLGEVISAGVNTMTMKLEDSGYQIIPVQSIAQIKVNIRNGQPIAGKFLDWSNGETIVRVGDRDIAIRDGTITSVSEVGVAAGGPKLSTPELPPAEEEPAPLAPAAEPTTPVETDTMPSNATM